SLSLLSSPPATASGRSAPHYGKYGLGQSLIQAPFFALGHVAGRALGATDDRPMRFAVSMANAFVTAALAGVFWVTVRVLGGGVNAATATALMLGLTTLMWPYARSDFSEPLQTLCLLVVFLAATVWRHAPRPALTLVVGCSAAGAFLTKATSVVVLAPLGAYFAFCLWERMRVAPLRALRHAAIAAGPLVAAVGFQATLNIYRFGRAGEFGYGNEPIEGFTTPLLLGVRHLLFSSGKGLVWFAPLAVLGAALLPGLARRRPAEALTILCVLVAELLYFSRWWAWHGDWSWGPRYLVLTVPFLLLPVAVFLGRRGVRVIAALLAAAGLAVAALGVLVDYGGYYSVVSSQIGRGVDVKEARLVPQFSPILGHAWLARGSWHDALARWRDPDRDARDNPAWGEHPWVGSHPEMSPEAPERAVGFDLWFVALDNRTRFVEFWSWLIAVWLAGYVIWSSISLRRGARSSVQGSVPAVVIPEPMEPAWQRG
ncbi:MAG: hypothetical protein ACR2NO_11010, partial [Chloroflexota bacterium]